MWIFVLIPFLCISITISRDIKSFFEYFMSNGAYLHPLIETRIQGNEVGYFWKANGTRESNVTIAKTPRNLTICLPTKSPKELWIKIIFDELQKGKNSSLYYYFQMLPNNNNDDLSNWEVEELEQLESKSLIESVKKSIERQTEYYNRYLVKYPTDQINKETFLLIKSWIDRRAFGIDRESCLIPVADIFNHHIDVDYVNWEWDSNGEFFELQKHIEPIEGEEIFISYGTLSRRRALFQYGFVEPDALDLGNITISLHNDLNDLKNQILETNEITLKPYDDGKYKVKFLQYFRVLTAPKKVLEFALKTKEKPIKYFNHPISIKHEIQALELCMKTITDQYPFDKMMGLEYSFGFQNLTGRENLIVNYLIIPYRLAYHYVRICERILVETRCLTFKTLIKYWVFGRSSSLAPRKIRRKLRKLWKGSDELCI